MRFTLHNICFIFYISLNIQVSLRIYQLFQQFMEKQKLTQEEIKKFKEESFSRLLQLQKNPKWEQFEDDPCDMFSLEIDGRVASKGQIVIPATVKQIDEFLSNEDSQTKLSSNVKEFRTIEDWGECKIKYRRHEGSWPVQDRDFIMCTSRKYQGDTLLISSRSIDYDFPPVKDVTRAVCYIGGYIVEKVNEKESRITYFSDVDLKGSIPGILKNKISRMQAEQPGKIKKLMVK